MVGAVHEIVCLLEGPVMQGNHSSLSHYLQRQMATHDLPRGLPPVGKQDRMIHIAVKGACLRCKLAARTICSLVHRLVAGYNHGKHANSAFV